MLGLGYMFQFSASGRIIGRMDVSFHGCQNITAGVQPDYNFDRTELPRWRRSTQCSFPHRLR